MMGEKKLHITVALLQKNFINLMKNVDKTMENSGIQVKLEKSTVQKLTSLCSPRNFSR
jgi:hypothetical protein